MRTATSLALAAALNKQGKNGSVRGAPRAASASQDSAPSIGLAAGVVGTAGTYESTLSFETYEASSTETKRQVFSMQAIGAAEEV